MIIMHKKIVRLENGGFVKSFQYSQGYFDLIETPDVLQAEDFTHQLENFETFFKKRNASIISIIITVTKEET